MDVHNTFQLPNLPELNEWQDLSWQPNEHQQQQFQQLYQAILAGNRQFNLTRIVAPADFWEKHLWDSLTGLAEGELAQAAALKAIDIGTGAGFPGIPIAIARPNWHVTLLDSTGKKVRFLQTLLTQLGLNATALVGRAEAVGQQLRHRDTYDVAFVRAVGAAVVCAEYAVPLLRLGGLAVLYRGCWSETEKVELEYACEQLGAQIECVRQFTTPLSRSIRHCVYLRKHSLTSAQFPRSVGIPTQHPLSVRRYEHNHEA